MMFIFAYLIVGFISSAILAISITVKSKYNSIIEIFTYEDGYAGIIILCFLLWPLVFTVFLWIMLVEQMINKINKHKENNCM